MPFMGKKKKQSRRSDNPLSDRSLNNIRQERSRRSDNPLSDRSLNNRSQDGALVSSDTMQPSQAAPIANAETHMPQPVAENYVPHTVADPYVPQPASNPYDLQPSGQSGKAIASLVCGIVGIVCCPIGAIMGPIAVCLGIISNRDRNSSGGRIQSGACAPAGIITGAVGMAISIFFIIFIAVVGDFSTILSGDLSRDVSSSDAADVSLDGNLSSDVTAVSAEGNLYVLPYRGASNWHDALNKAQAMERCNVKGDLAAITSSEEQRFVAGGFPAVDTYIGLNDISKQGNFEWSNGERFSYSNWAHGEPNDDGEEDCVEILPEKRWNDVDCLLQPSDKKAYYLVEFQLPAGVVADFDWGTCSPM